MQQDIVTLHNHSWAISGYRIVYASSFLMLCCKTQLRVTRRAASCSMQRRAARAVAGLIFISLLLGLQYRTTHNYTDGAFLGSRIGDKVFMGLLLMTLYLGIGGKVWCCAACLDMALAHLRSLHVESSKVYLEFRQP